MVQCACHFCSLRECIDASGLENRLASNTSNVRAFATNAAGTDDRDSSSCCAQWVYRGRGAGAQDDNIKYVHPHR